MAEYVPFPTRSDEARDDGLTKRVLGCFGCGGLGVVGFVVAVSILVGGLAVATEGCELDLGDPGKGTDSLRLPVEVAPRTGLEDGARIRVTSDAFEPRSIVGVAVCLRSADTERRGVDACDEAHGARYAVDAGGRLDATFAVPRVITVGDRAYDCATRPQRCIVVAADANDYDRSGGQTISFRSGLPRVELTPDGTRPASDHLPVGAEPSTEAGPLPADTELTVLASGFQPGEPLLVAYCTDELEERGVTETCEPLDPSGAVSAIALRTIEDGLPTADASGAFTTKVPARATIAPFGADLGKALSSVGSTTTTTLAGTSTTAPGTASTTGTLPTLREGEARCTVAGGGCSIVIAAAADTKRSAVLPYVVAG